MSRLLKPIQDPISNPLTVLLTLYLLSPQPACVGHGALTLPHGGAVDGAGGAFGSNNPEPGRRQGAGGGDGLAGRDGSGASIGDAPPAPLRCDALQAGRRRLRRLTAIEFDSSVRAALGIPSAWGQRFAADPVVEGFDNDNDALVVTPLLVDQIRQAAEALSAEAAPVVANAAGCGQGEACAGQLIRQVGRRAFRRPLQEAEVEALVGLFDAGSTDGGFVGGVQTVLEAMLQSPHFLYRLELGEPDSEQPGMFSLTSYEVATELSFLVTGGPPDDALLDAAAGGDVEVAAHIADALAEPGARAAVHAFVARWLDIDRIDTIPKDGATYPELTPEVRRSMRRQTEALTAHVLDEGDGTLTELLTADYTFVDDALAELYDLPRPVGDGMALADVDDPARMGILGQASFLTTHARPDGPSPVHRGKAVRERLLCQPLPPPPPGLNVELPPFDPTQGHRERYEAHFSDPNCQGCHQLMDPVGHGFDGFDGIGRATAAQGGADTLDLTGRFIAAGDADGEFDGPVELARRLAASDDVHDCFSRQWLRFAYATSADDELSCLLPDVQRRFRESGGRIESLLQALVESTHFKRRVGDQAPPPPPPADDPADPTDPDDLEGIISAELAEELTDDGVNVAVRMDSEWADGWCQTVTVTNGTNRDHTWAVDLDVPGTINNLWNAVGDGNTGDVEFRGVEWNQALEPGGSAEFGFCAGR